MAPSGAAQSLTVQVRRKARQVALLNAVTWSVPNGTAVARMTVEYVDGGRNTMDLTMGQTTASWMQDTPAVRAAIGWQAKSPAETPLALRVTRWDNPFPEKQIVQVRFESVGAEAGWVLAGMTLLH